MIEVKDIYWAAGFLDGEGCFQLDEGKYPRMYASQKNRQLLDRLVDLFGGKVNFRPEKIYKGIKYNSIWEWKIFGNPSAGIMMTI